MAGTGEGGERRLTMLSSGGGGAVLHGGAGGRAARRVGALVSRALEEVVLQRIVRRDARLGVIIQHAADEILEFEVVRQRVACLPSTPAPWPTSLHPYDIMQPSTAWGFVLQTDKQMCISCTTIQSAEVYYRVLYLLAVF